MARGGSGAFGGKTLNRSVVWLAFCAVFLLGLFDWRRPLRLRNVDLLVLLSFTVSLWFFNDGDIFASVPLAYPPLAWLLGTDAVARLSRQAGSGPRGPSGRTGCSPAQPSSWPGFASVSTSRRTAR